MKKKKLNYNKPTLTTHGTIKEITKGGGTIPGEPMNDPSNN